VTFILAWVAFPIVLAVLGLGWGVVVEELSGARLASGALVIPVGLAGAVVVAGLLTTNGVSAPLAVPVEGIVGLAGLVRARTQWPEWRVPKWSLLAALGVLLAYGAPVLATGTATFTGFVKLDDTSTWLGITAHLFSDGRSSAGLQPSTYKLILDVNLAANAYPVGGFMLLGVGAGLTHVDPAWVYQPYLACAGAALAMCLYALIEPLVGSPRLRAVVAFVAAQPALLYGYSLWGGIKEVTAAFLLALIAALCAALARGERAAGARETLPLAVATAALIVTFGPGTAVWVVPALGAVVVVWIVKLLRSRLDHRALRLGGTVAGLAAASAVLALPVWITLARALHVDAGFANSGGAALSTIRLGNLGSPLSGFEIAGIWPVGDFREPVGSGAVPIVLIGLVLAAAVLAGLLSLRARSYGVVLYAAVALCGCAAIDLAGAVPWIVAKALAITSPAVLLAGMAGGAMLWPRNRLAAVAVMAMIGGGVLWSNVSAYRNVTIAPVSRLEDLAHIGELVHGEGPTLVDDFAVYADRYFLRAGDPVEPAEFRTAALTLTDGTVLNGPAAADIDSFSVPTVLPYRSIVTTSSPTESRPSSLYHLRWAGRYYELWQRAAHPTQEVLAHIPYGDSTTTPYCGGATAPDGATAPTQPICSVQPVGTASCKQVASIAGFARSHHAEIVAAERPANSVVRGDQITRPPTWGVTPTAQTITALTPGTASVQVRIDQAERYSVWLGGSFGRGFVVSLDGHRVGRVANDLSLILGYTPVATVELAAGLHTFALTYPRPGLGPGADTDIDTPVATNVLTTLSAIVFEPQQPARLVTVGPQDAKRLCGKLVDWIEVVSPTT